MKLTDKYYHISGIAKTPTGKVKHVITAEVRKLEAAVEAANRANGDEWAYKLEAVVEAAKRANRDEWAYEPLTDALADLENADGNSEV